VNKEIISTSKAPAAVGPYSQAVRVGDLVFAAQIGIVPGSTELAGPDIETQTRQTLNNLKMILEEAGSCLKGVAKTTVLMQDIGEFARMNAVYAEFFPKEPPTRATAEVARLPLRARVEIDVVAVVCDSH
jgi:2-iminobutanoate/2-iminopropanoate deaminase